MICTTLNRILEHDPCVEGWKKLLQHLGKTEADDEPLPFSVIVESNGINDALWACCTVPEHDREWRLFAVWCARQVQHLMTDQRSHDAIDVAERFALGAATKNELAAAKNAALAAESDAARKAACHAAVAAAFDAAKSAACDAAAYAAKSAACDAAWSAQKAEFLRVVTETECCEVIRERSESERREEFFRKFGND